MATPPHTPAHSAKSSVSSIITVDLNRPQAETEDHIALFPLTANRMKEIRLLGEGSCSTVYEYQQTARPRQDSMLPHPTTAPLLTPPPSPHHAPEQDATHLPKVFAIKIPLSDRGSKSAVRHEARVLSYLNGIKGAESHIVTFYGLIETSGSAVLDLLPHSLASYTESIISPSPDRRQVIAASLRPLMRHLSNSLQWLHTTGTVHVDVKPANILLRPGSPGLSHTFPYTPVLCDFSSAICPEWSLAPKWGGGGTYDFMSPRFFTLAGAGSSPTADDDGYAAVMTGLWFACGGESPFRGAVGNRAMRMAWIKKGDPVGFVRADGELDTVFGDVEELMAGEEEQSSLEDWFRKGLQEGGWKMLL